jgi:hypothetical protein
VADETAKDEREQGDDDVFHERSGYPLSLTRQRSPK